MRVGAVTLVFAAVAAAVTLGPLRDLAAFESPARVPWWILALGFGLVEIFVIHLERGRQTHTFSVVEIPMVVGMFLAAPVAVVTARLVGAGAALAVHRRQAPAKLAFNLSMFGLET